MDCSQPEFREGLLKRCQQSRPEGWRPLPQQTCQQSHNQSWPAIPGDLPWHTASRTWPRSTSRVLRKVLGRVGWVHCQQSTRRVFGGSGGRLLRGDRPGSNRVLRKKSGRLLHSHQCSIDHREGCQVSLVTFSGCSVGGVVGACQVGGCLPAGDSPAVSWPVVGGCLGARWSSFQVRGSPASSGLSPAGGGWVGWLDLPAGYLGWLPSGSGAHPGWSTVELDLVHQATGLAMELVCCGGWGGGTAEWSPVW